MSRKSARGGGRGGQGVLWEGGTEKTRERKAPRVHVTKGEKASGRGRDGPHVIGEKKSRLKAARWGGKNDKRPELQKTWVCTRGSGDAQTIVPRMGGSRRTGIKMLSKEQVPSHWRIDQGKNAKKALSLFAREKTSKEMNLPLLVWRTGGAAIQARRAEKGQSKKTEAVFGAGLENLEGDAEGGATKTNGG